MDCLIAIFTSIVISVMETVGIIMCCRFSDKIGTSMMPIPESLIEDVIKLSEIMAKIKPMGPSESMNKWMEGVDGMVEEARHLLQPAESRSPNNNDDRQSSCDYSYHESLPRMLQMKVKKLMEEGQRIIYSAEAAGDIASVPDTGADNATKEHSTFPESEISEGKELEHETLVQQVGQIDDVLNIQDYETMRLTLRNVEVMLGDNGIRKIGIWGPGGVGKTTLLHALRKKLSNTSSSSPNFSLVIFISITRDVDVNNMQKAIAAELKLNMKEGMDTKEAANQIHDGLQRRKFLLILDDVWEYIDLSRIGIPENQPGSKIVLTTRSLEVCNTMEAEAIKMNFLTGDEARELFSKQVGDAGDAQQITPLAENVCKGCGGLPLALVYVGSSMRGKTHSQWQNAVEKLENSVPFNDSVLQVYNSVKLSYDSLKDDNLKSCFLYCSLFPKGSRVEIRELVECWVAENLIDSNLDYVDAVSVGLELIGKLKNCSLLEVEGEGWGRGGIVMNAMVANVARWIARSEGISLVFSGYGNSKSPYVILPEEVDSLKCISSVESRDVILPKEVDSLKWLSFVESRDVILPKEVDSLKWLSFVESRVVILPKEVDSLKWISFVENKKIELIENVREFPSATTVIVGNSIKGEVLQQFLQGFGALRVLHTKKIRQFPVSPLKLNSAELRALFFPPGYVAEEKIGELAYVQNLIIVDISASHVRKLPRQMEQFTNLKVLNLSFTRGLESIDLDILCALEKLEVLDTRRSSYKWSTWKKDGRSATLLDLSRLSRLKAVYVELADVIGNYKDFKWIEELKSSLFYYKCSEIPNVQMGEKIICIGEKHTTEIGSFFLHAEHLHLIYCFVHKGHFKFPTSEISISKLKSLHLKYCSFYDESTETALNSSILSNVEELQVSVNVLPIESSKVVDFLGNYFPALRSLVVVGMSRCESVDIQHMKLPKLERITVRGCGNTAVFHWNTAETPAAFPNLKIMELENLWQLKSLSDYEWNDQWNRLRTLTVIQCPHLKKLPRMSFIEEIRGSVDWWNSLEWDDEETRSFMNQHFKPRQIQPPSEWW